MPNYSLVFYQKHSVKSTCQSDYKSISYEDEQLKSQANKSGNTLRLTVEITVVDYYTKYESSDKSFFFWTNQF